jgi:hypothetical protein
MTGAQVCPPRGPRPRRATRAELHLARDEADLAVARIERFFRAAQPPTELAAPVLLLVQAQLAQGDAVAAAAAAAQLRDLAAGHSHPALAALTDHARDRLDDARPGPGEAAHALLAWECGCGRCCPSSPCGWQACRLRRGYIDPAGPAGQARPASGAESGTGSVCGLPRPGDTMGYLPACGRRGGVCGLAFEAGQAMPCGHRPGGRLAVAASDGGARPRDRVTSRGIRRRRPQRSIHPYWPCR